MRREDRNAVKTRAHNTIYCTTCIVSPGILEAQGHSHFQQQRQLFQSKLVNYWTASIQSCHWNTVALWRTLHFPLEPTAALASSFSAEDFASHFTLKYDAIRQLTNGAPFPFFCMRPFSGLGVGIQIGFRR
jgi:hypothetical protein